MSFCKPIDSSTPGFPVLHYFLKFAQTYFPWVDDPIQPPHNLLTTSPALSLPQHKGLFPESALHIRWQKDRRFSISPSNNIQGWSPSEWTDWISLQSKRLSRVFSSTTVQKQKFFGAQPSLWSNSHICTWPLERSYIALTIRTLVHKVMLLFFNTLSRFIIVFPPRSKCLLISWLQLPSAVILEPMKIVCHCFYCFPIYLLGNDGTGCHDLSFKFSFKSALSLSSFTFIKRLLFFTFCHQSVSLAYLRLLILLPAILIPAWVSPSPAFCILYSVY